MNMNKFFLITFLSIFFFYSSSFLYSENVEFIGAKELLQRFSVNFKNNAKTMRASFKWIQGDDVQEGTLLFKNPQKLRINFSTTKQVICTNGYMLWVYIDYLNLLLRQEIRTKIKSKDAEGNTAVKIPNALVNLVGYDRYISDYSIDYDIKNKIEYKDGSFVYRFKLLRWRSSKSGFNVVYLTVNENGIIRKVEGITPSFKKIIIELDNVKLNEDIGDVTFEYDPPAHVNIKDNFIIQGGE